MAVSLGFFFVSNAPSHCGTSCVKWQNLAQRPTSVFSLTHPENLIKFPCRVISVIIVENTLSIRSSLQNLRRDLWEGCVGVNTVMITESIGKIRNLRLEHSYDDFKMCAANQILKDMLYLGTNHYPGYFSSRL